MITLHICPVFAGKISQFQDLSSYKEAYEKAYKPLGVLLFGNQDFKFSFHFSGPQLELFKKHNPEFVELLKTLLVRKQIEIIGGGYYNPLFPLLFPMDRSAQIEKLSLAIRQNFGRRPRGMRLFADSWDPSLVLTLDECNMEYVLLENALLPIPKQLLLPVVMSDRGKTAKVLPVCSQFVPKKNEKSCEYLERILSEVNEIVSSRVCDAANADCETSLARMVAVPFDEESIAPLLEKSWLEEFAARAKERDDVRVEFSLPNSCAKSSEAFAQGYIHAGINPDIAKWCSVPYQKVENSGGYPTNIYDYIQIYDASRSLYNRMVYISLLLNQCRGDKIRRNAARDKLMAAQAGEAFICRSKSELEAFAARQMSYKNLTEAEKILRECSLFKESVTSYDYDGDGFCEYVCRLEKYGVCITQAGGSIFELNVIKSGVNYVDNFSRISAFDGIDDDYFRGIFVDHIFEEDEAAKYCRGETCRNGLFSARRYREISFSSQKQEILLETRTRFSTMDQPILLRKKYSVNSNGILVQYIIRNEGPIAVKAKFAVEMNLAELNLLGSDYKPYNFELVSAGSVIAGTSDSACHLAFDGGIVDKVSAMQISDANSGVSFVFTPNEEASVTYFPVSFRRRNMDGDIVQNESRTFVSAFIWDLDLPAGMEVEKTISFALSYARKQRKK